MTRPDCVMCSGTGQIPCIGGITVPCTCAALRDETQRPRRVVGDPDCPACHGRGMDTRYEPPRFCACVTMSRYA